MGLVWYNLEAQSQIILGGKNLNYYPLLSFFFNVFYCFMWPSWEENHSYFVLSCAHRVWTLGLASPSASLNVVSFPFVHFVVQEAVSLSKTFCSHERCPHTCPFLFQVFAVPYILVLILASMCLENNTF